MIGEGYLSYNKVKEVAAALQVTDATLCRECNKQCGLSCKKLLLYLKVRYAAGLIESSTLFLNKFPMKPVLNIRRDLQKLS